MRVGLTKTELETSTGKELLDLAIRIATDGKLELEEVVALRRWLRLNKGNVSVSAIPYLQDIMTRIASDGVIDRDELLELQLAIERVIPTAHRTPVIQARKQREEFRRERKREQRRAEQEKDRAEQKKRQAEERVRSMRLRHSFAKVSGVTFPNDDGSERQAIIKRCRPGEQLVLKHDAYNKYSICATKVLRSNGEQLGHAPEYMAERIVEEVEDGRNVAGILTDVTGGTFDKPTRGVNFVVLFASKDVTHVELQQYANQVLADRTGPNDTW